MGDRYDNIRTAIVNIEKVLDITLLNKSNIYESDPMYNESLDKFYNSVIEIRTKLSPLELLKKVKSIESAMGRNLNNKRYSARIIDIDILTYGQEIINLSDLVIPHPQIKERKFVLKPWADINPHYILANCDKKIFDLLDNISDNTSLKNIQK